MPGSSAFVDHVCELLAPLGPIRAKRMFGAWGLYCGEAFFAIIDDDVLYLKASAATRERFLTAGGQPFTYSAKGAERQADYYTVPESALEDYDELRPWAQLALSAARRTSDAARKKTLKRSAK